MIPTPLDASLSPIPSPATLANTATDAAAPPRADTLVPSRRHDLDWLRVLAFGLLILFHCGMYYVADWNWHIKSAETSEGLQNLMLLTNPWRMSLLFLVSGAAMFFACRKISRRELLALRNRRLLLPLLFGMAVIVPPQLYVELLTKTGDSIGYGDFYALYADVTTDAYPEHQHSPLGLWTYNHLWFLAYLWLYTLVFVVVKPLLDRGARALQQASPHGLALVLLPALLLMVYRLTLATDYPPSNALFDDWYNHVRYLSFLFAGYLLVNCQPFWTFVGQRWPLLLTGAATCYALVLGMVHGQPQTILAGLDERLLHLMINFVVTLNPWLWILSILGMGVRFLNRGHPVLTYMNDAILPWYMLHQTLIVLLAYGLSGLHLPTVLEATLIVTGTVVGCALGYEVVRRFWLGRLLFGLKNESATRDK